MTEDIKEAAEALIVAMELEMEQDVPVRVARQYSQFRALKAFLKPSKEEVADYLEHYNGWQRGSDKMQQPNPKVLGEWFDYAIEYLRE